MRRLRLQIVLASGAAAATLFVMLGPASAAASPSAARRHARSSVAVVGYTTPRALRHAVAAAGGQIVRTIPALRVAEVRAAPGDDLEDLPGVRYARPVALRHELTEPALVPAAVPGGAYEWQFAATREPLVPAAVSQAASTITIAVLDTGADLSAPDVGDKAPATWSVLANSTDVTDTAGHGTFVSSLADGAPADGEGIAGFGGDAKLLVVQVGDDSGVADVDEAAGIVYAVDHGAKIINMSFGGVTTTSTEQAAIDYAVSHGVLLVAAAGNSGDGANQPLYPAALLQPIGSSGQGGVGLAVGATNVAGTRASFSNYGSYISLVAPGEDVFGAISTDADPAGWPQTTLPGSTAGVYGYSDGTSFSAPEVAGAAALVWAANPALTATGVAQILKQTASGGGTWNQDLGYGIVDVAAAVARAQGVALAPPVVTLAGTRSGTHVSLSWGLPNALSYNLTVSRDSGPPQVLLGSTTRTTVDYDLDPGHSYSFAVSGVDIYGFKPTSVPYAVSLPQSAGLLTLRASPTSVWKGRRVRFWAMLAPADRSIGRGGRTVVLESFDGKRWRPFAESRTGPTGVAAWSNKLRRGTYSIRAHFAGALDLAETVSGAVRVRVR